MGHGNNSSKEVLRVQGYLFSRYLVGKLPSEAAQKIFVRSVTSQRSAIAPDELRVLSFAIDHPWSIRFIDAYLALFNPDAELRRRIYIMFAALECTPEYSTYFLPRKQPITYLLTLLYEGVASIIYLIIGAAIVRLVA